MPAPRPGLAQRWHAVLLRAYPRRYRERFGEEMRAHFFAELDAARASGGGDPVRLWIRTLWHALWIGSGEHLRRLASPSRRDPGAGIRARGRRPRTEPRPRRLGEARPDLLDQLVSDVRFTLRGLRRAPTFAATAISTLAIGIGAAAAALAATEAVLLRPLPYQSPERLVTMSRVHPRNGLTWSRAQPPGILQDLMERSRSFAGVATVQSLFDQDQNLSGTGEAARVDTDWVSPNFFDLLGVEARIGRTFGPGEGGPGSARVAVLSHGTWASAFGADPTAVGDDIVLNETAHTIVGVMPESFRFVAPDGGDVAVWLPEPVPPEARDDRWSYTHRVVARLRDGVPLSQAQSELDELVVELARVYPDEYLTPSGDPWIVRLSTLHDTLAAPYRLPLLLMAGAVGLVLVITWINVGNLLLSRTSTRADELAIRAAVGAGRWRVTKQLLTEALVLSVAGGLLGLAMARWLISILATTTHDVLGEAIGAEAASSFLAQTGITGWVAGATALTCLVTAAACALGPVTHFLGGAPFSGLVSGGRDRPGRRLGRQALAAAQLSLTTTLLIGVALLTGAMSKISRLPLGFEPEDAVVMRAQLAPERYATLDRAPRDLQGSWSLKPDRNALVDRVKARLDALPGVEAVGATTHLPFQSPPGGQSVGVHFVGLDREVWRLLDGVDLHGILGVARVTPGYFAALGLPVVQGRAFSTRDDRSSGGVVIVNEKFVADFELDAPVGQQLLLRDGTEWRSAEIVGVVGNTRIYGYPRRIRAGARQAPPEDQELYVPFEQAPETVPAFFIGGQTDIKVVVRHGGDPDGIAAALRSAMAEADPDTPVTYLDSMERYVSGDLLGRRLQLLVMGALAAASLLLALIGAYGLVAFEVSRRVREMGIRLALGAREGDVTAIMVGVGARFSTLGILGGVAGAMVAARLLSPWLYEVSPTEPGILATVGLAMAAAAVLACWIPARRAALADPIDSLRSE
ncbi:MAG TPA: ADOP family duplicated permease [Longimicrobiales bacterium]|nr:ADOP family duplicated permease [Longimicrobiales bacterium]